MNKNNKDKLFQKGMTHFQNQNLNEAKIFFNQVLDIDSNDIKSNHALGVIYGMLNEHKNARSYFEKVLEINPQFQPSQLNLVISLRLSFSCIAEENWSQKLLQLVTSPSNFSISNLGK